MDKLSVGKRVKVQNMPHHRLVEHLTKMGLGEEEVDSMSMDQLRDASADIIASGRETPPEVSDEVSTGSVEDSSSSAGQIQMLELERIRYERERAERRERRKVEEGGERRKVEEGGERRKVEEGEGGERRKVEEGGERRKVEEGG